MSAVTRQESSALRAVVPASLLRKWDVIAAQQLFESAPRLADELEQERRERQLADDCARMWQDIADIRERGGEVGLTVDCEVCDVCAPDCWCCQQESRP